MNQGKGQQIEIAVNGERVALLDINPAMTLAKDGMKTRPIKSQGRSAADFGFVSLKHSTGRLKTSTEWWSRAWWT